MATFSLCISGDPNDSQAHHNAFDFIYQCYQLKHSVAKVFLYADAIEVTREGHCTELQNQWQGLAKQYNLTLDACIGAAEKRGINQHNVALGFRLSGLGELADMLASSNKFIHFK